jgi:hypothetical protein
MDAFNSVKHPLASTPDPIYPLLANPAGMPLGFRAKFEMEKGHEKQEIKPSPAKRRRAALRKAAEARGKPASVTPPVLEPLPSGVHRGSGTGRAHRIAEKLRIVTEALSDPERCMWSDQRIAKALQVSQGFVSRTRRDLIKAGNPHATAGKRHGTRQPRGHTPEYAADDDTDDTGRINHAKIESLSRGLKRPMYTLVALTEGNDPFFADREGRRKNAEWFANIWRVLGLGTQIHTRRVHYQLTARPDLPMPDGRVYQNTETCSALLSVACRDARYLGLIPREHIIDNRNAEAQIRYSPEDKPAEAGINNGDAGVPFEIPAVESITVFPPPPELTVTKPMIAQPRMVEIWIEKSTMNDVLDPIAVHYGVNLVVGLGETSEVRCRELVARARAAPGKPVRILYVSDFDPGGDSMPVAAARKIEFWLRRIAPDLDVQVRPVALNKEQIDHYALPPIPLKDKRRGKSFQTRKGGGSGRPTGVELDALEARVPGELDRLLRREIERYFDDTLEQRIDEAYAEIVEETTRINTQVLDDNRPEIDALRTEQTGLATQLAERLAAIKAEFSARFQDLDNRTKTRWQTVASRLDELSPDLGKVAWPEPLDCAEDPDPMFDSTRGYVEQMDRYKEHQGKPTTRKQRTSHLAKRDEIKVELLKDHNRSNNAIGKIVGSNHVTVAIVRAELGLERP